MQSFQYKILNRILNCRERLYRWKITDTNICLYCETADTLENHLFLCKENQIVWNKLEKWIADNLETKFKLTECEVIFGIPLYNDQHIFLFNFLIIITKWFINKKKSLNEPLYFIELLNTIRNKITLVIAINKSSEIENEEWQDMLNEQF